MRRLKDAEINKILSFGWKGSLVVTGYETAQAIGYISSEASKYLDGYNAALLGITSLWLFALEKITKNANNKYDITDNLIKPEVPIY